MPEVEKTAPEQTPYGQVTTPRNLAHLRLRAEECVRSGDDSALLDLTAELRQDRALWAHLWAPSAAVAAARAGRDDAWDLLDEAVAGGFCQPALFEGTLDKLFGSHPGWQALRERMRSAPPPTLELLHWPAPEPHHPLTYDAIPADREELLRDLLPPLEPTSWATAAALLAWVHHRWEHANDHVEAPDAVEVLRRVAAGERFACVEYSIVLSQSLNARGIPARRLHLRQADHHVGVGRGHVVSEAWIDDLRQWVLLDGQNGAYWADEDDRPLALPELLDRYADGAPPPPDGAAHRRAEVRGGRPVVDLLRRREDHRVRLGHDLRPRLPEHLVARPRSACSATPEAPTPTSTRSRWGWVGRSRSRDCG